MASTEPKKTNLIETLQSLVVAFVLAMVFRGFVVEGFVIPTGSMAPTLLGQHLKKHSNQTGKDFEVGFGARRSFSPERFSDPMLGRNIPLSMSEAKKLEPRGGDRILVLKTLYPFFSPERYDVVVFKNPTDTQGPSANYIKRLIGLPGETIWIADGDIFAKQADGETFEVQRKPEYIQQALWRPVSSSDSIPTNMLALSRPWQGSPWIGKPSGSWTREDRTWYCTSSAPTVLEWDHSKRTIDDWLPYNMLMSPGRYEPTSDIRVSATITPKNTPPNSALTASFSIETLQHRFIWMLSNNEVSLTMTTLSGDVVQTLQQAGVEFTEGKPIRVACWHVDQMMALYVHGTRVAELFYDFSPEERLRLANDADEDVPIEELAGSAGKAPSIQWQFDGSPLSITRLEVDHDLYYLSLKIPPRASKNPTKPGKEVLVRAGSPGFGTHPDALAVLGADQFMMAGDNSRYSLDSRLWGNPDEFVSAQIDDSPFVVNRKLLIGKAWGVYWLPPPLVPEFSRFRIIR